MKGKIISILSMMLILLMASCSNKASSSNDTIVIGCMALNAEAVEEIKRLMEKEGYKMEVKVFDGNNLPALALSANEIDGLILNHKPWIDTFNKANNSHLVLVDGFKYASLNALYSSKHKTLEEIPDGATITISNDPSNMDRGLRFLEKLGLLKLGEKTGEFYTMLDIKENPKSYWAFHHRRWCYEYMDIKDVSREIDLCGMLLAVDARNFHAWRHRRWAVQRCGDQYEKELKHTYDLIASNFSNYSAWHYRSQLPNLTDFKGEIEMAKTAMWTDPRDQSAWIYYRWLLNRPEIASDQELLHEELQTLKELQEEEPNCKYIYLAQLWIQRKIEDSNEEEIKKLIEKLSELDPIRAPYYKEL